MNEKLFFLTLILIFFIGITFGGTISKQFEETLDITNEANVKVKNVNGKIYVESWEQDKIEIFADIEVKASHARDAEEFLDKVEIKITHEPDEIYIHPDHPKANGNSFFDSIFGHKKPSIRVDFSIKVPEKAKVNLNSMNGSVQVVNIGGRAVLSTVNGKVDAKQMHDFVEANTTNGGISVEFDDLMLNDNMSFHTVNGSIKLYIPKNISADVNISTVNGGAHTDFPLTFQGKWGPKSIKGKINGGGPRINLETINGSVSLYEN